MIYTSYFAKLKQIEKLNDNEEGKIYIPVSICGKAPEWYTGLQYKKLAPKYGFFMEWKQNHDNDFYIEHFNKEVLDTLDVEKVIHDLFFKLEKSIQSDYFIKMAKGWYEDINDVIINSKKLNIVLLCYEKPSDFCHRHLVADCINEKLDWEYVKELEF